MAEALVKFFLQRLNSLLLQETKNFCGLEDQIEGLVSILREVGKFFGDVGNTEGDAAAQKWITELRDLINSIDDCFDKYIIQMDNHYSSDRARLTDSFNSELQKLVSRLAKTAHKMTEVSNSTMTVRKEEDEKNFSGMNGGETSASSSFILNYMKLPYYLQYCLMYCCIFPENYQISKGRLIRLLVAEGLIQEKEAKIMEDIAEDNINELFQLGMLLVDDEHLDNGTKVSIPSPYRNYLLCKMKEDYFNTACISSDSSISPTTRRVSIHSNIINVAPSLNNVRLRSLFLFGNQDPSEEKQNWLEWLGHVCSICSWVPDPICNQKGKGNWLNFYGAKFLWVLDLEDAKIKDLPDEVGDLIHLRYLGLKHADISELPEKLGNLQALQTLDIRWCGNLTTLPDEILNLVRLRHLKMFKNKGVCGMMVPSGIGRWTNLLTLIGLHTNDSIARELGSLMQLRRLGVMDVTAENISELFASIMKMQDLLCLSLEAKHTFNQGALALLDTFSPPPLLQKLRLEGVLERMPNWLGSMERLTKLRLGFSHLAENPSLILQVLPNLKILTLWHAYDAKQIGREFCKIGGFPKLEVLTIASDVLEEWTELEKGVLPNLKYLHLHNCLRLRMLPEGLQFVTTLKQLMLLPLLDDHAERLRPDGGMENYKISHIPMVKFITMSTLMQLNGMKDS